MFVHRVVPAVDRPASPNSLKSMTPSISAFALVQRRHSQPRTLLLSTERDIFISLLLLYRLINIVPTIFFHLDSPSPRHIAADCQLPRLVAFFGDPSFGSSIPLGNTPADQAIQFEDARSCIPRGSPVQTTRLVHPVLPCLTCSRVTMAAHGDEGGDWCNCHHAQGEACSYGAHPSLPPLNNNRFSTGSGLSDPSLAPPRINRFSTGSGLSDSPIVDRQYRASNLPESEESSDKDAAAKDGGEIQKIESQAERMSKGTITAIMFSLCMALFLAALDVTIITTALPTIATHFDVSAADYTWIGSAYLVACAGAVPVWGKLSDIWGRKPALLLANAIFCAGSLVSATSVSAKMLIGGRVIQGIGGGGLIILVNICISDIFSMRERGKYLGMVGATWAIASGVGPLLGGVFSEKVSWRWCCEFRLLKDMLYQVMANHLFSLHQSAT